MPIAILCSGQGQQHPGMFDLVADAPEATKLFEIAATLLGGHDPRDLVRRATAATLEVNRTAQILCVLQAVALHAALGDTLPPRRLVAGYSVGEVAAWALAGLIDNADALHLGAARAEAMDAASVGAEGLTFVRGLSRQQVDSLCDPSDLAVAIVNPGNAFVLGGSDAALRAFESGAVRQGATRIVRLNVHVASHTARLGAASVAFAACLKGADIHPAPAAGIRLYAGIDGMEVHDSATGIPKLANQISHTVQWSSCMQSCLEAGATSFIELGPGRALTAMLQGMVTELDARTLDDFRTLSGVRSWVDAGTRR